jgi:hypothetical protein
MLMYSTVVGVESRKKDSFIFSQKALPHYTDSQ